MLSPEATFFFILAAFACFVVDVVLHATKTDHPRAALKAAGLALWIFPTLWVALKAL